jgi:alpha-tubulin suppressor-like RCC1 family protein
MLQSSAETNWVAVAMSWQLMVALKSDGTLWKWEWKTSNPAADFTGPPTRLGIHHDWVAIAAGSGDGVVALAADGSLWFWPYRKNYEYETLLKLPKQPQLLDTVFGRTD